MGIMGIGDLLIWAGLIGILVIMIVKFIVVVTKIKSIAIKILIVCAVLLIIGFVMNHATVTRPAPKAETMNVGPTQFHRVNERVVELNWNGGPQKGFNLSAILPMQVGDRVIIYWLGGCLQPHPVFGCYAPWGLLDIPAENLSLFQNNRGQFAVQILHGDRPQKRERWRHGAKEMVISVQALPLKIYLNTMVNPGIYFGVQGVRVPIDGYSPPIGLMHFRIVNQK